MWGLGLTFDLQVDLIGYLWQSSSSDIMVASEPRPLSGALTGIDQ